VLIEETLEKLHHLRMATMAAAVRELLGKPPDPALTFEEKLGLVVDREWTERENRRLARRLKEAKLGTQASLEEVTCDPARGLDKAVIRGLSSGRWIKQKQNVVVVGATGAGKTYLAAALAQAACRQGYRALCTRVPRLVHELGVARADGRYTSELARLARFDVLVLDDFLLNPLAESERRDLLEVVEDRYDRFSTVITSQLPTKAWHAALGEPTIADAICDRLVHNAHVLALKGPSMRKRKAIQTETA
jgi:DNA replication protein DnaC